MSLIIASNVNLNDPAATAQIHRPYSWSNRLSNTFKIEPDSEIAVQSVKINKNGLLSVGKSNTNYSMYMGKNLDDDYTLDIESLYHPVADTVIREGVKDLSTTDFATEMEKSFKNNIMHPGFYVAAGPACTVDVKEDGTTGAFDGYVINVEQDPVVVNVIPPDTAAHSVLPTDRFTYTGGVMTKIAEVAPDTDLKLPKGATVVFKDRPVLLSSPDAYPSVNYDITNAVGVDKGLWSIGLTRYNLDSINISPTTGNVLAFAPPYYDTTNAASPFGPLRRVFFDYVAVRTALDELKIFHAVVDRARSPEGMLIMREVKYYTAVNPIFKGDVPYDLGTNPSNYTNLRFRVENEGIVCEIGIEATGVYDILVDTKLGDKTTMFKPRSCLNNFLYPQIQIQQTGVSIGFEERYTYASINTLGDNFFPDSSNVDWVARLVAQDQYIKWGKPLENRIWNDYSAAALVTPTKYPFSGFTPYGTHPSTAGHLLDIQMNIICAPSRQYGVEYTSQANSQYIFGFTGRSLAIGDLNTTTGGTTIESVVPPLMTSDKSLFVRVNNLTQQSVNAQLGNAYSKIISHLPRFDSAGNETGALFLQSNELVYVSLNNPSTVFLNSFDIDIVYDNEQYADCLSGKSIVVLHIRPRKK